MNTYYEGLSLYLGDDIPMYGIMHGKHYMIKMQSMASKRVRVTVLDCPMSPVRFTFASKGEADLEFMKRRKTRKGIR